jgi:hypothetical protein
MTTTNFIFACASINGLTFNQKRATLAALKVAIKEELTFRRLAKASAKLERKERAEARRIAAIAKAKAKLDKLMAPAPVGAKATKANKKPSKAIVTKVPASV